MNDIKSIVDVERILAEQGYKVQMNENSVTISVGSDAAPFPCLILMDETDLTVVCEVMTYGQLMERIAPDMREDFYMTLLDMNSQTKPYSFSILSDIDGEGDERDQWPLVLINSIPVGDISQDELLAAMRGLSAALLTAKNIFDVSLVESL